MARIQEWIYRLEEGHWKQYLTRGAFVLAVIAIAALYNLREFRAFSSVEAMDAAQLARNIAEGQGFTTDFVRPLAVRHLLDQGISPETVLNQPVPDLNHPPLYPLLLAGLFKVLPVDFDMEGGLKFESLRYQPEMLIGWFNQLIFLGCLVLVYFLGVKLLDPEVAWLTVALLFGSSLLWEFSISGQSTLLLMLIFLLLIWGLVQLEAQAREPEGGTGRILVLAAAVGLLLGVGMLTRYAFGWLILPVSVYLVLFLARRKAVALLLVTLVFAAVVSPWLYRNYQLSGAWFGLAGYALVEETATVDGEILERSLNPNLDNVRFEDYLAKWVTNSATVLQDDLPRLGGNWITAFFFVGLLLAFKHPGLNRLRVFLLLSLGVWAIIQALGRTHLSKLSPEINSENLLVLLMPLVFLYGAALFYLLLDQVELPFSGLRNLISLLFALLLCLPLVFKLLPPREYPVAFPPYHPPRIQATGRYFEATELILSDKPWALAWYGDRQSMWLTINPKEAFDEVDLYLKSVKGLYLMELELDTFVVRQLIHGESSWGTFVTGILVRREIPDGFPLKKAIFDYLETSQFFLADRRRW